MAVQQPEGAIRSIGTGTVTDQMFSPDGTLIYTTRGGTVTAYSVATGAFANSWTIGKTLGGIDVSPDGRYLVATEQQNGPATGSGFNSATDFYVYRLDLTSGVATTYTSHLSGYVASYADVSFLPDGKALLTQNYPGSGWVPLTTLDFDSGIFTASSQIYAQSGTLTASPDRSHILFSPRNISDAPIYVYTAGQGITATHGGYADDIYGFNSGVQAISPTGNLIAEGVGLAIYDSNLRLVTKLGERYPFASGTTGLAFSPDGSKLYLLDRAAREVFVLNTTNWDVLGGYPVGAALGDGYSSYAASYGNALQVSADGSHLSVIGAVSVQVIDLGKAVSDAGTIGDDVVIGDSADNVLYGFEGNDTLDGKAGTDTLHGGSGDDSYYVDNPGDTVVERENAGNDVVFSSVSYSIPGNVEKLVLTGTDATSAYGNELANALIGNDSDNYLYGSGGDDVLTGNGGNDVLDGGQGNDRMAGGAGDDTYHVESPADVVIEMAGAGTDTVMTALDYMFGANVENLTLLGNNQPLSGTGNALDNVIIGNDGDNLIIGGLGSDTLTGGFGRDIFRERVRSWRGTGSPTCRQATASRSRTRTRQALRTRGWATRSAWATDRR
ncbi:calcium-binding protein [Sphingomonas gellani]|nr:calcium-binding protein [Sphingomonas gellani]